MQKIHIPFCGSCIIVPILWQEDNNNGQYYEYQPFLFVITFTYMYTRLLPYTECNPQSSSYA
ncbi:hypothetical protein [Methanobrevibacter sp.]|uniref:hypothetical protein n=1 Tax=Methanobrevibacter sp. TaxID=66852 RepID=UPI0038686BC5